MSFRTAMRILSTSHVEDFSSPVAATGIHQAAPEDKEDDEAFSGYCESATKRNSIAAGEDPAAAREHCPGPPAEGPCGARPCVGKFPMWHLACLASGPLKRCRCDSVQSPRLLETSAQTSKTLPGLPPSFKILCDIFGSALVLSPTKCLECKFDPEEQFLNSPARMKSRSNPVPQRFISSPREKCRKAARYPRSFSAGQLEKRRKQPGRGQNTCFQRSECQGDAEFQSQTVSRTRTGNDSSKQKGRHQRKPCERKNVPKKEQRRWVTWTSAGAQRTEWIPTELPKTGYRRSSRTHSVARTKEGTHQPKRFPTEQPVTGRPLCDHARGNPRGLTRIEHPAPIRSTPEPYNTGCSPKVVIPGGVKESDESNRRVPSTSSPTVQKLALRTTKTRKSNASHERLSRS